MGPVPTCSYIACGRKQKAQRGGQICIITIYYIQQQMLPTNRATLEDIKNKYSHQNQYARLKIPISTAFINEKMLSQRSQNELVKDEPSRQIASARAARQGKILKNYTRINQILPREFQSGICQKHSCIKSEVKASRNSSKISKPTFINKRVDCLVQQRVLNTARPKHVQIGEIEQQADSCSLYNSARCIQNVEIVQRRIKQILCSK